MPFSRLFRSRWAALFWAAGICWAAVSTVGGGETSLVDAATSPTSNAAALSALAAEDDE